MNKLDFDNFARMQVMSLPDMGPVQVAECFGDKLTNLLSTGEIAGIDTIVITGCGDSYAASLAFQPTVERSTGCRVLAPRAVEFTRFVTSADLIDPKKTLVIGISTGGSTARVVEVLKKANEIGAISLVITNGPDSICAGTAKHTLVLGTPEFPNDFPGLRSYVGSLVGILAVTALIGKEKGVLPKTAIADWSKAIAAYIESYRHIMDKIDDQIFALSSKYSPCETYDFLGDGVEYASAFFGGAKFLECGGILCSWDDTEDWCHVGYFLKNPETVGTVFSVDKHAPDWSRVLETVGSAHKIGRPVLVVSNADKSAFPEGVDVCTLPDAAPGYEFLLPLMDHIPATLLAGYVATMQNIPFFRRTFLPDGQPDPENPWKTSMTIRNSKLEIHA